MTQAGLADQLPVLEHYPGPHGGQELDGGPPGGEDGYCVAALLRGAVVRDHLGPEGRLQVRQHEQHGVVRGQRHQYGLSHGVGALVLGALW